jgi:hypothetical protein
MPVFGMPVLGEAVDAFGHIFLEDQVGSAYT